MNDEFPPELQQELLDDFYAECDELFGRIQSALRAWDEASQRGQPPGVLLEPLQRSLHTLKGNCGIVGLRPAENLAHALEDQLRRVASRQVPSDSDANASFRTGIRRLEELVAAQRQQQPLPDISDLLASHSAPDPLDAPARAESAPSSPSGARDLEPPPSRAPASALCTWEVTFAPSPERDQRGINLSTVRERLTRIGTVTRSAPVIAAGRAITFVFTLETREAEIPGVETWPEDGLSIRRLAPESAPEQETRESSDSGPAVAPPTPVQTAPDISERENAVVRREEPSLAAVAPSHVVRVDLSRLDELMRIAAEMVIQRSRLEERLERHPALRRELREVTAGFGRSLRDLRAAITRVRLVPVAEIFSRLPYAARDVAREAGRQVSVRIEGEQTEIDKYLVERLREPLLHLVRNAVSHGAEASTERIQSGKSPSATLILRAFASGPSVVIEVEDDGRGIDRATVAARARALGLPLPNELDDPALLQLLARPEFSTRSTADLSAGRGVGMAVVADTVRELGGVLALRSRPGEGTCFTLRMPLTLSITDAIIVWSGARACAVPQAFVEEVLQFDESDVRPVRQVEVIPYRDGVLPLVRLDALLHGPAADRPRRPALVLRTGRGSAGLVVDRVVSQREIVVRPLNDPLVQVAGFTGATELGDGRPVLVIDPATLPAAATRTERASAASLSSA